jgi:beta-lactam-binding protein with PASTA domain
VGVASQAFSALKRVATVILIAIVFVFGLATTVYLSLRSSEVTVPEVIGKDRFEAEKVLAAASLNFRVRATRPSNQVKADTVLFQLPHAGDVVKAGQTVAMDVSRAVKEGEASEASATDKKAAEEKASENRNSDESASAKNANENKPKRNKNTNTNKSANENSNAVTNAATPNSNTNKTDANANRATGDLNRSDDNGNANATRNANQNENKRPPAPRASPPARNSNGQNP